MQVILPHHSLEESQRLPVDAAAAVGGKNMGPAEQDGVERGRFVARQRLPEIPRGEVQYLRLQVVILILRKYC